MKMTRTELKSLIKECLVEILADGLGHDLNESISSRPASSAQPKRDNQLTKAAFSPTPKRTPAISNVINEIAHKDPMMASLMEDTLKNMSTEENVNEQAGIPIDAMFKEGDMDKWAELAFK